MWRGSMAKSSSAGLSALPVWNWCDASHELDLGDRRRRPCRCIGTPSGLWAASPSAFIVQAITGVLLLIYYRPGPK